MLNVGFFFVGVSALAFGFAAGGTALVLGWAVFLLSLFALDTPTRRRNRDASPSLAREDERISWQQTRRAG